MIGTLLGRYRIVSLLGQGGMGVVYKAFEPTLDRHVAIKVLPAELVGDAGRLARLKQEARAASSLNHPNVVTIHEIGEAEVDGKPVHYLAMELVDGETLRALLGGGLDPKRALRLVAQVAEGLAAAHAAGIVHRDIKPENIMVASSGFAKILDFGLAKAGASHGFDGTPDASKAETATEAGTVLGTIGYLSPEQAQGRPADHRSDIFSLGCVLYEAVAGRRAFQGGSSVDVLHRVIHAEPEPLPVTVPDQLRRILRKTLAKDPDDRYQSTRDLAIDLRDAVREMDAPAEARKKGGRRPRLARAAALAAGLLLVAVAGALVLLQRRRADVGGGAPMPFTMKPVTSSGNVIEAAISPDGLYVAYVESEQGEQSLRLKQLAGGSMIELIPKQRVLFGGHTFVPGGTKIAYGVKSDAEPAGVIMEIPTLGGTPRTLVRGADSQPAFSPDGMRMAWLRASHPTAEESALMVANADGSDARVLATRRLPEAFAPMFYAAPSWSPDGTRIAASVMRRGDPAGDQIVAYRADTGALEVISTGWRHVTQLAHLPEGNGLLAIAMDEHQSASQVWLVPYPKGTPRPLTNDLLEYRSLSLSRDGRALLTVAMDVRSAVFLKDGAGQWRKATSSRTDGGYGLCFLADGRIVYTSVESGALGLSVMNADGTGSRRLTSGEDVIIDPRSGAGALYALAAGRQGPEIRRVALDGGAPRTIVRSVLGVGFGVSPDGRFIAYTPGDAPPWLLIAPVDGGPPRTLTELKAFDPAFSSDGKRIAFSYLRPGDGRKRIGIVPVEGGAHQEVLADVQVLSGGFLAGPGRATCPAILWEPGGKALLAGMKDGDRTNIWRLPLDGSAPTRATDFDDSIILGFAVSPDGRLAVARGTLTRDALLLTGFR